MFLPSGNQISMFLFCSESPESQSRKRHARLQPDGHAMTDGLDGEPENENRN